jgi:sodium-dependent dicarboxylate transporter 2/3/5
MLKLEWKTLLTALGLFAFLMVLFLTGGHSTYWNAIALGGLMIFLWVIEAVSIYVTALLPLILAIPLGLLSSDDLANAYGNSNVYLFFGGFVLALGLEKWKVHEQIAYAILTIVGDTKPRILLGFLLTTGFLSMWISNTATALMMMPLAIAIIKAMPVEHQKSKFSLFLMLSIAYASSIGGMGTLVGTPTNTQMAAILQQNYHITIGFFDWMKIGMPLSILLLLITFVFFYFALGKERYDRHDFALEKKPWTRPQYVSVSIFGLVVLLWSFRELIKAKTGFDYHDESAAIFGAILMFSIPGDKTHKQLLSWKDTEKLPWGILLLFGGGLALARFLEVNGVINELTKVLQSYSGYSIGVIILVMVIIGVFASEILSNLALVVIFVPIVAAFAKSSGFDIVQMAIPLTLAASCAFMMPVGTPPNAIVFASGYIKMSQMVKVGFVLNIISILLITLFALLFL